MELTRREFLRAAGALAGGVAALGTLGSQTVHAAPPQAIPLQRRIGEKTTICPYDATGCGFIVAAEGDQVVNIEGDPDHPINRGAACSKGASLSQLRTVDGKLNPRRLTKVLYRKPGGTAWEEKTWDWTIEQIARRIKDTRDANFATSDSAGNTVNRTEAVASLGGIHINNEECYLLVKAMRALGLVYLEHQARL